MLLPCLLLGLAQTPELPRLQALIPVRALGAEGRYEIPFGSDHGLSVGDTGLVTAIPADGGDPEASAAGLLVEVEPGRSEVLLQAGVPGLPASKGRPLILLEVADENPLHDGELLRAARMGCHLTSSAGDDLVSPSMMALDSGAEEEEALWNILAELRSLYSPGAVGERELEPRDGNSARTLQAALSAASVIEVRQFLQFIADHPGEFAGRTLSFGDAYCGWLLTFGDPNEQTDYMYPYPGLLLGDPGPDGFPQVKAVDRAYHRQGNGVFEPGARLLTIGPENMHGVDAFETRRELARQWARSGRRSVRVVVHTTKNTQVTCSLFIAPCVEVISEPDGERWESESVDGFEPRLWPVLRDGYWGFIDASGAEVLEPMFDDVASASGGAAFAGGLEPIKSGGLWGFQTLSRLTAIEFEFAAAQRFRGELAAVQLPRPVSDFEKSLGLIELGINEKPRRFITRGGSVRIEEEYGIPLFGTGFADGRCVVVKDGRQGVIDARGELLVPLEFHSIRPFEDGVAITQVEEGGPYGYLRPDGTWAIEPRFRRAGAFEDGRAIVFDDQGAAVVDAGGEIVTRLAAEPHVPFQNDRFRDGLVRAKDPETGLFGFLAEADGEWAIPPRYADASGSFQEGLVSVLLPPPGEPSEDPTGWHFIDPSGAIQLPGPYGSATYFSEGRAWVQLDGKWGIIDRTGAIVLPPSLELAGTGFSQGISRSTELVDEGKPLPTSYPIYLNRAGEVVWSREGSD